MSDAITARYSICVLENSRGELLLAKRSESSKLGAGLWGFPAGHIEAGETALDAARRELREEIGNEHDIELRNEVGPMRDKFYGGKFEINVFHFHWAAGTVTLNEEHSEYRWVDQESFFELDVMLGIEQDIVLLDIWPREIFDPQRLH